LDATEEAPKVAATEPIAPSPCKRYGQAFCVAPWSNLNIAIGGDAKPCCEIQGDFGNVGRQSLGDIWNGALLADLRTKLLADERDIRCSKCYEIEATGGQSLRKLYNEGRASLADRILGSAGEIDESPAPLPIALDLRFSNLCNFSCRTCGHSASTKWFSEARKMGWAVAPEALIESFSSTEAAVEALRPLLPTVEQVYFAGGEPLLIAGHYALLQELIARGRTDVELVYNSNMSELGLGKLDVLALWSHFDNIIIQVSIDGSGPRGELIREGLSWTRFVGNLATIRQSCPHVRIRFGITVSVFNVFVLPGLYRELLALGCAGPQDFHFHVLQEPNYYSIQILPRGFKKQVARHLVIDTEGACAGDDPSAGTDAGIDVSIRDQFRHIVGHMMAADRTDLIHVFQCVTAKLDAMRGRSTAATCPELAPLLRFPLLARLRGAVDMAARRVARVGTWMVRA
jgi:MoaA/NifB/PqqE/SkfB family radical SAM enzyme